jgi:hypothetical protein
MTRVFVYITQTWGVEYPSYPCRQKVQILLFNSKWDILLVLNTGNEKHFVSKNRGTAPLSLFSVYGRGAWAYGTLRPLLIFNTLRTFLATPLIVYKF